MAKLKPYIYAFVGIQGSGKGTQAEIIKSKFNMPLAITGDIIRAEAENDSDLGKRTKDLISKGELITLDLWKEIMGEYLKKQDLSNGILLDGSPRTMEQAKALEELIKEDNFPQIKIIYIKLPREVAIARLLKRRICPIDKKTMSEEFCQEHQVKTVMRHDDTPEAINRRIDLYFSETEPILDFYRPQNDVITINGDQSIDDVGEQIVKALQQQNLIHD